MTILPKKKNPKERQDDRASTSRGHGIHAPVCQASIPGATQYTVLSDGASSTHNPPVENLVSSYHAHAIPGPSHLRPQTVLRINSPASPSNPRHLSQLNRNKKLKVYSDDDENETESDGGRNSTAPGPSVARLAKHADRDHDGCNSDDEFGSNQGLTADEWIQKESAFAELLKEKRGFIIRLMKEDGACLFRAVADQVFGDQEMHDMVRQQCMDYMERNEDYFSQYVTEDFQHYISRKRNLNSHGNHVEIQSMSEMYNRRIEVYQYDIDAINVFQGSHPQENAPIRVSYHQKSHYNSIVDPYSATVGVGLGLPNLQPGLAEQRLVTQAVGQSEQDLIEKQMLEDKLLATDWEATNEAIEQQIAQASYLEWMKESENQNKHENYDLRNEPSTSSTSHQTHDRPSYSNFRSCRSAPDNLCNATFAVSTDVKKEGSPKPDNRVGQLTNLPPALFGLNDWDEEDGDLLAQVLAASQAEYLESLKPRDS